MSYWKVELSIQVELSDGYPFDDVEWRDIMKVSTIIGEIQLYHRTGVNFM